MAIAGLDVGGFKKAELLGQGAFGKVFRYQKGSQSIAVKEMYFAEGNDQSRMNDEIRALQALSGHENILQYLHHEVKGNEFIVYMELCSSNLADYVKKQQRISLPEKLEITLQISNGLKFVHGKGIIHRDLKPANILLKENPKGKVPLVKLADFGMAFLLSEDVASAAVSTSTLGTNMYMPPEVAIAIGDNEGRKVKVMSFKASFIFSILTISIFK